MGIKQFDTLQYVEILEAKGAPLNKQKPTHEPMH